MPTSTVISLEPRDAAARPAPVDWPALDPEAAARQGADLALAIEGDAPDAPLRARCALWWSDAPPLDGERLGVIGQFGAADAESARTLLDAACEMLATRGCTRVVGPMDGNTWRRYRLVVERGDEPPFLLEPWNPPAWPAWWEAAGFAPIAHYFSAVNEDLARRDPRAGDVAARLRDNGVTVRPIDIARFDAELEGIFDVSTVSFQDAFLYTPLARDEFLAQYRGVRPLVVPELALVAEREGRTAGFSFAIPDAAERARGAAVRTVILKTLAILPDRALYGGLGSLLADRTHATAHAMGFSRAIHALMHETNHSRAISARTGRTMRRYALYARPLPSGRVMRDA